MKLASRPIRFLHIPKTAGTTYASGLMRIYGRNDFFAFTGKAHLDRERFFALPECQKQSIHLFLGHSMFQTGVPEADTARVITVLRDPVQRVKSFIQHVSEGKSSYLRAEFPAARFSVDEFLESSNGELSNLQAKMLINRDQSDSDLLVRDIGPSKALDLALKTLFDDVYAFAIQDLFNESWVHLWNRLECRPPLYAVLNTKSTERRVKFTPDHITRIQELNSIDIQLYQAATTELQRRFQEDPQHADSLISFQRRQSRWGPMFSLAWNSARRLKVALR